MAPGANKLAAASLFPHLRLIVTGCRKKAQGDAGVPLPQSGPLGPKMPPGAINVPGGQHDHRRQHVSGARWAPGATGHSNNRHVARDTSRHRDRSPPGPQTARGDTGHGPVRRRPRRDRSRSGQTPAKNRDKVIGPRRANLNLTRVPVFGSSFSQRPYAPHGEHVSAPCLGRGIQYPSTLFVFK